MTTFVNPTHPYLRVLLPDGSYAAFQGGRLEMAEDDPDYDHVLAVALADPYTSILVNETTCIYCGEVFKGDRAAKQLDDHMKAVHFDLWQKQLELDQARVVQREVKARAGVVCDVCSPVQTFGTEADLAEHVKLHTAPPAMDDEGNEVGGGEDRRPGERPRAEPASPTARRSTRQRSS